MAKFSKAHYILIASAVKDAANGDTQNVVDRLIEVFQADNRLFDPGIFRTAVFGKNPSKTKKTALHPDVTSIEVQLDYPGGEDVGFEYHDPYEKHHKSEVRWHRFAYRLQHGAPEWMFKALDSETLLGHGGHDGLMLKIGLCDLPKGMGHYEAVEAYKAIYNEPLPANARIKEKYHENAGEHDPLYTYHYVELTEEELLDERADRGPDPVVGETLVLTAPVDGVKKGTRVVVKSIENVIVTAETAQGGTITLHIDNGPFHHILPGIND